MKKVLIVAICIFGLFVIAGVIISNGKSENNNSIGVTSVKRNANQANQRHTSKMKNNQLSSASGSNTQQFNKNRNQKKFNKDMSYPSNYTNYINSNYNNSNDTERNYTE